MKLFILILVQLCAANIVLSQDSSYVKRQTVVLKSVTPFSQHQLPDTNQSKASSVLSYESKQEAIKKLADTNYLNQIAGTYLRSDDRRKITIRRNDKTLFILIPGHVEDELTPVASFYFTLKNNPDTKMFLFIDPKNTIQGINIQNRKENYAANRDRE